MVSFAFIFSLREANFSSSCIGRSQKKSVCASFEMVSKISAQSFFPISPFIRVQTYHSVQGQGPPFALWLAPNLNNSRYRILNKAKPSLRVYTNWSLNISSEVAGGNVWLMLDYTTIYKLSDLHTYLVKDQTRCVIKEPVSLPVEDHAAVLVIVCHCGE